MRRAQHSATAIFRHVTDGEQQWLMPDGTPPSRSVASVIDQLRAMIINRDLLPRPHQHQFTSFHALDRDVLSDPVP